jgi:hypothetical protein
MTFLAADWTQDKTCIQTQVVRVLRGSPYKPSGAITGSCIWTWTCRFKPLTLNPTRGLLVGGCWVMYLNLNLSCQTLKPKTTLGAAGWCAHFLRWRCTYSTIPPQVCLVGCKWKLYCSNAYCTTSHPSSLPNRASPWATLPCQMRISGRCCQVSVTLQLWICQIPVSPLKPWASW